MADLLHPPDGRSAGAAGRPVDRLVSLLKALIPSKTGRYADRLVASHAVIPERTMRTMRLSEKLLGPPR